MFKRTKIRLVALYVIVLFLVLNCFAAVLYFSVQQRVYDLMDRAIEREMRSFSFFMNRQPGRDFPYRPHRLMSYMVWDGSGGSILAQSPKDNVPESALDTFRGQLTGQERLATVSAGNEIYRVMTRPFVGGHLQIAYNLHFERNTLDNFLFFIGVGSISSVLVAIVAAYILASRAFIPIQKAWDQQQQFISDASHELRTPLSVLQLNLERLFRHPQHTVEQESRKISVMIDETRRMSKLVEDLLTLARSDSRQLQILKAPVQLSELLWKSVHEFQDIAMMKDIELQPHIEKGIVVSGDSDRLHQLFIIILDNAVKYTAAGTIRIHCELSGAVAKVIVRDTGAGISAEDLPYIFNRFYRADKVRSRTDGGTGLGLSIAKWIVEAHRGTIHAESELESGTTIHIHLPAD